MEEYVLQKCPLSVATSAEVLLLRNGINKAVHNGTLTRTNMIAPFPPVCFFPMTSTRLGDTGYIPVVTRVPSTSFLLPPLSVGTGAGGCSSHGRHTGAPASHLLWGLEARPGSTSPSAPQLTWRPPRSPGRCSPPPDGGCGDSPEGPHTA